MTTYLVIPGITDYVNCESLQIDPNGKTFIATIAVDATATQLFQASMDGRVLELVVVATDAMMLALDNVVISGATISSMHEPQVMTITLDATEVRQT